MLLGWAWKRCQRRLKVGISLQDHPCPRSDVVYISRASIRFRVFPALCHLARSEERQRQHIESVILFATMRGFL